MVKSVAHILETEFGRSLSDTGVHIIDPFVGTGNFYRPSHAGHPRHGVGGEVSPCVTL